MVTCSFHEKRPATHGFLKITYLLKRQSDIHANALGLVKSQLGFKESLVKCQWHPTQIPIIEQPHGGDFEGKSNDFWQFPTQEPIGDLLIRQ